MDDGRWDNYPCGFSERDFEAYWGDGDDDDDDEWEDEDDFEEFGD